MSGLKKCRVSMKLQNYSMARKKLGKAVIFNNEHFEDEDLNQRRGTEKDAKALMQLLDRIGFETKIYQDLDQIQAITELGRLSQLDYGDDNCFVAVFLSHGESDRILMRKGQLHVQDDILYPFRGNKCRTLSGKPKIFIVQACRGLKTEEPAWDLDTVDSNVQPDAKSEMVEEEGVCVVTPAGSDFIVCYAAANGYVSYRNIEDGSWFIENLVAVMDEYVTDPSVNDLDFASLMTLVAKNVARKRDRDAWGRYRLQIPCTVSTLKKEIFLPRCFTEMSATQIAEDSESDHEY